MTIEPIGILALLSGIVSFFLPTSAIVVIFVCSTLLGSSAALIFKSLGGINIQPAHLLLGVLGLRLLGDPAIVARAKKVLAFGRPGFWLLVAVLYSTITAYALPRLFAGQTVTVPIRAESAYATALAPSMQNLTQSAYLIGDLFCFIILAGYAGTQATKKVLENAALACIALNLVFAGLDLITYFTGTTELLSFIRNANYSMLNDSEVAGFKRIVGSFLEASAFGAVTLGYFAFTGRLWLIGVRARLTATLTALSLAALIFSTSTTAYVGVMAFLAFAYLAAVFQFFYRPITVQTVLFVFGLPLLLAALVVAIALSDSYSMYMQNLMDTFVLGKMTTRSGMERAAWNQQAIQNVFDTFGFGVGTGSVRAASYPIVLIASLGFVGAIPFVLFFITLFGGRTGSYVDPSDRAYRQAAKAACFALLIVATVSGALVDLGLPFFIFAALACCQTVEASLPAKLQQSSSLVLTT
jgi:hypothetical protein